LEAEVFGDGYDPNAPVEKENDEELIQDRDPDAGKVDDDEALMRADRRRTSPEKGCGQLADKLEQIASITGADPGLDAAEAAG
jgi:hypothetical protein|tara:strand:+ start:203 stop:451 length:249 start_codon:yes stop_codon:yes gene_type:complete